MSVPAQRNSASSGWASTLRITLAMASSFTVLPSTVLAVLFRTGAGGTGSGRGGSQPGHQTVAHRFHVALRDQGHPLAVGPVEWAHQQVVREVLGQGFRH